MAGIEDNMEQMTDGLHIMIDNIDKSIEKCTGIARHFVFQL